MRLRCLKLDAATIWANSARAQAGALLLAVRRDDRQGEHVQGPPVQQAGGQDDLRLVAGRGVVLGEHAGDGLVAARVAAEPVQGRRDALQDGGDAVVGGQVSRQVLRRRVRVLVGQQERHHPLGAERLDGQGQAHRGVDAAADAQHGAGAVQAAHGLLQPLHDAVGLGRGVDPQNALCSLAQLLPSG